MSQVPDRGRRDGLQKMARPIAIPWTCHQTGDCCRSIGGLTVTAKERDILEARSASARVPLEFLPHPDDAARITAAKAEGRMDWTPPAFYILQTKPDCPFISDTNQCLVYDARPFNCRRFLCGRVDVSRESLEQGGPMGCYNLSDRIDTSLRFMEFYKSHERHAMQWARQHGWK